MAKKKGIDSKSSFHVDIDVADPTNKQAKEIPSDVQKAFDKVINKLNDDFGSEGDPFVYDHSTADMVYKCNAIPTGLPFVDEATGIGGIPDNAIIELYGPEGSGKSFIAQCAAAMTQRQRGKYVVYADIEGGLDQSRMQSLGIDMDKIKFLNQDIYGEQLFDAMYALIESGTVGLIVVDSVAAIRSITLAKMSMEEQMKQVGVIGRLMSNGLKKLSGYCKKYRVPVIFVNQLRMKVGVMFGNPEDTPGGRALKFFAQFRMDVRPYFDKSGSGLSSKIMDPADPKRQIGQRSKVRMAKNKFAPPFGEGMFEIYFSDPDPIEEIIRHSKTAKLWFNRNEQMHYKALEGITISCSTMEEFRNKLTKGGYIIEMAERLIEAHTEGKIDDLLGDDFDFVTLEESIAAAVAAEPVDREQEYPEGFEPPSE